MLKFYGLIFGSASQKRRMHGINSSSTCISFLFLNYYTLGVALVSLSFTQVRSSIQLLNFRSITDVFCADIKETSQIRNIKYKYKYKYHHPTAYFRLCLVAQFVERRTSKPEGRGFASQPRSNSVFLYLAGMGSFHSEYTQR